jgi:trimethylamine--corrinoid protein Co-methyltransferase
MSRLKVTVLRPSEIAQIHKCSLQVLETVGFQVQDAKCRQILAKAGAKVDQVGDRVCLPAGLVEEALQQAPSLVRLCRQDGKMVRLGGKRRVYSSLVVDPWIIDYETQRPRRPVLSDLIRHTCLGDAHPLIDAIHRMDMPPADMPPETAYVRSLEAFVTHTRKHLIERPASAESLRHWVEVAEILADGRTLAERPLITFGAAITSPLTISGMSAEILKTAVRKGVPVLPTISAMAGSTSPRSFAGTLVSTNAENLFSGDMFDYSGESDARGVPSSPRHKAAGTMLAHAHSRVQTLLEGHAPTVPQAIVDEVQRWARRTAGST